MQKVLSESIYSKINEDELGIKGENGEDDSVKRRLPDSVNSCLSRYPKYPSFFKRGFFNTILFKWLDPIFKVSGRGDYITDDEINEVDDDKDIRIEYEYFIRNWREEFSKPESRNSVHYSTYKVIFKTFYLRIVSVLLFKLVHDIIHTVRPWQIKGILSWINDPNGTRTSGMLRFLSIVICDIVSGSLLQQYFRRSFSLSIMLKGVMNYALSHKLINLTKKTASENMSKCISFFSSESTYLLSTGNTILAVPSMIFQNILLLISLYSFIGVSAFIGYIIIVLSLFINGFLLKTTQVTRNKYINSMNDRISLSSEFVHSFKQIKCYAWESYYLRNITNIREEELRSLSVWRFYNQLGYVLASLGISISPVIAFGSFLFLTKTFPADIIFTSMLVFELLQVTLVLLPTGLSSLQKLANTYTRLSDFLLLDEIEPRKRITADEASSCNYAVILDNVSFSYPNNENILNSINLKVRKKETVGIIGSVGSGKTTAIELILNEIQPTQGSVYSNGSVFYCPQVSWVINGNIRNNIILDLPYEKEWYDKVIKACSLIYDLKAMPNYDLTEIGENGINLSGGQKQRISLARAVYQNPDILILDDVFSALDNIVANNIFQECILGLLKDKTIILATNKLDLLIHLDKVAFISNNKLSFYGPPNLEFFSHPEFQDFVTSMNKIQDQINQLIDDVVPIEEIEEINNNSDRSDSNNKFKVSNTFANTNTMNTNDLNNEDNKSRSNSNISPSNASRRGSRLSLSEIRERYKRESKTKLNDSIGLDDCDANESSELLKTNDNDEFRLDSNGLNKNKVDYTLYLEYVKQIRYGVFIISIVCTYLCSLSILFSSFWLSFWSRNINRYSISTGILIFFSLSITQPIFVLLFKFINIYMTNNASKRIYNELLKKLTFSKLSFYESVPIGTILSRITSDIVTVDEMLPQNLSDVLLSISRVTIFIGYFVFLDYRFLFLFATLLFLFIKIRDQALNANRQLKRIFHRRSSPILSSVSHTIEGISVIRCSNYGLDNFLKRMQYLIDYESAPWRCFCLVQRWMGIHIDLLGACVISSLGVFCVLAKNEISVGSIGIAFQCSSSLTQLVLWMIRTAAETENNFLSFERVQELVKKTPQEQNIEDYIALNGDCGLQINKSSLVKESSTTDPCSDSLLINIENSNLIVKDWPKDGNILFENIVLQYNSNEPPVISNLNLSIKGGKKVGICGRTGSGKSSLLSTILRLYDIQRGRILIDGVDISKICLKQLRSLITIIPQEPNILTGTLRYNLDPHDEFTDDDINEALVNSNSMSFVNSLPDGINTKMSGVLSNISIGQKQLICLARALLRKSKIILFDEATSSVDIATDNVIQKIVKEHFNDCTILSIAHRVHTIIDFDYIVVLDKGRVIEYDTPHNLLSNTSSVFYSMVNEVNTL